MLEDVASSVSKMIDPRAKMRLNKHPNLTQFTVHVDVNGPCDLLNTTNTTIPALPRFVHLSCYKDIVPQGDVEMAKVQCLGVFAAANPECLVNIIASGNSTFGCDVYFVYSFASKKCRLSYQTSERSDKACILYQNLGLGKMSNFKRSTLTENNYQC
jgi:hypothetical protein